MKKRYQTYRIGESYKSSRYEVTITFSCQKKSSMGSLSLQMAYDIWQRETPQAVEVPPRVLLNLILFYLT